ncbi:MAG: PaaI family thioesterase [Geminicoccaceae bacterium]|nr:MAG: PaaI family thioesterase [Geminicoccaceae bacterium]
MSQQTLIEGYFGAAGLSTAGGFEATVGYHAVLDHGEVVIRLDVTDAHCSRYGLGHGGVTLTLLDTVGGVMLWHELRPERIATINLACQFLDVVKKGPVVATAKIDRLGHKIAHTTMALHAHDKHGPILATAVGSYRLYRAG